jgi:two-component system, LytTR family, sensor kinase
MNLTSQRESAGRLKNAMSRGFRAPENVLNLRSFWQIQIVGWCCFYLFNLLESIHNFLTQRVSIEEQTVPIFFMFLGSCALRPFCRRLLRQSQSWIAFELKAAAAAMVTSIPVTSPTKLLFQWAAENVGPHRQ